MPTTQPPSCTALTIGKIESGMAVALTNDLQMLELPLHLLPPHTAVGSIVTIKCTLDRELVHQQTTSMQHLQDQIRDRFAKPPSPSALASALQLRSVTNRSATIGWPSWTDTNPGSSIKIFSIIGSINEQQLLGHIRPTETVLRLTGLEAAHPYQISLAFRTSAGIFTAGPLAFETLKDTDFSSLSVAINSDSPHKQKLLELGCCIKDCPSERTSLFLSSGAVDAETDELCRRYAIPIVTPAWINACQLHQSIQPFQ